MRNAIVGTVVGMLVLMIYISAHIAYGQNTSSHLTIDQTRLHTFQQLDKDANAGNLTASDVNNAHTTCNQLKQSGAPMFMFHFCSSMLK